MPKKEGKQKYRSGNQIWVSYTFMDNEKTEKKNKQTSKQSFNPKGNL